ncbi:hypothetical protein EYF80_004300 [Liparis tanakae]|uniref:Uncharacterized protein n=1 Tax=Liparis tanakae TaxID=230148 RepID=A0A4Z2J6J5_9TELE|nr:hypothetical protein EYF80_004300 [Liparis tanakae]
MFRKEEVWLLNQHGEHIADRQREQQVAEEQANPTTVAMTDRQHDQPKVAGHQAGAQFVFSPVDGAQQRPRAEQTPKHKETFLTETCQSVFTAITWL